MKQTKRTSRRQYADRLWAQAIKTRDGVCQMCGADESQASLQSAHFFRRAIFSTRWDKRNGALLCLRCHGQFDRFELDRWTWIRNRLGDDELQALTERARLPWHRDYNRVFAELKEPEREKERIRQAMNEEIAEPLRVGRKP